ncbi:MAG: hypothetical protein ABIG61_07425 [Planctomycetota bacterium]
MCGYGNTEAECVAKINSYRNTDRRCTYLFTCKPLGYCWSYAWHIDDKTSDEDMEKMCKGCDMWKGVVSDE